MIIFIGSKCEGSLVHVGKRYHLHYVLLYSLHVMSPIYLPKQHYDCLIDEKNHLVSDWESNDYIPREDSQ